MEYSQGEMLLLLKQAKSIYHYSTDSENEAFWKFTKTSLYLLSFCRNANVHLTIKMQIEKQ